MPKNETKSYTAPAAATFTNEKKTAPCTILPQNTIMKTGLVLEGGGLRDMFTAGILDVMMDAEVRFDGIIGVSAGATFGCNYKSHQRGRTLRYNKSEAKNWRYCSMRSWITTGDLVGAEYAYHKLPNEIDIFDNATFMADPTRFTVVCTDAETGRPVYHDIESFDDEGLEWLRASASLPIVSRAVEVGGRKLLDGGITDSIPLAYWQREGFERNVVILTQPAGFVKKRTRLMPLFRLFCRRFPAIIEAMERRHEMYNAQLEYLAREATKGHTLVLCPDHALDIGRTEMNPDKMQRIYDEGVAYGKAHLQQIIDFVNQ